MEIYKRTVGYQDLNYRVVDGNLPITGSSYLITATTLYFPFMLTQNFEDMGLYTDVENPIYEIVDFSGVWNFSNTKTSKKLVIGGKSVNNNCLVLNNCKVSFSSVPISYYGASDGQISTLITDCPGPQTVLWSGPNNFTSTNRTINNLSTGSYTIKIIDSDCNITYANYFLTQPQSLSFNLQSIGSQTNSTTVIGCNGSASIIAQGGTSPYTYLWYSGNPSNVIAGPSTTITGITNLCAGTYNVRITDSANPPTMVSGIFVITEPTPISGSVITKTNIGCFGDSTGSITFSANGGIHPSGYTYILSGPVSATIAGGTGSATFNNLPAGSYVCTIYDNVGNSTTTSTSLTSPTAVVTNTTATDVGCYGSNDGSIVILSSGGSSPYNIYVKGVSLINPNEIIFENVYNNSVTINNLSPGTYTIKNKDKNLCSATNQVVTIKQLPRLDISVVSAPNNLNLYYNVTTGVTFQTNYYSDVTTLSPTAQPIDYYLDGVLQPPTITGLVTSKTITTMSAGTHTITAVNTITNCSATTTVTLLQ